MAVFNGTQFNDNNTFNNGAFRFSIIGNPNTADILNGFAGTDILDGRGGDDQLNGGSGNDTLRGGAGNDLLDGGTGADNMNGGDGIDTYFVDNPGDVTAETNNTAAGGFDTVIATATHTIGFAIEDLFLIGNAPINGTGNGNNNNINGNNGANVLNGAAGVDEMHGFNGNDTYIVDNLGDVVIEDNPTPAGGVDTVNSSVDFTLGSGLENLNLIGGGAIDGIGNELNNIINGNGAVNAIDGDGGNDTLNGGGGNDTLFGGNDNDLLNGGAGADNMDGGDQDDTYVVDNAGDFAAEAFDDALGGVDTVLSSVTHTLGFGIENLVLTGGAAINGIGNGLNNNITGNNAANTISGGAGDDLLFGGAGNDFISGNTGNDLLAGGLGNDVLVTNLGTDDRYLFDTAPGPLNVDQINEFFAPNDTILLENSIFTNFAPGAVAAGNFRASAAGTAADANDFLLYNTTTGALSYDSNGNGAGGSVQFAILSGAPPVFAADFFIV